MEWKKSLESALKRHLSAVQAVPHCLQSLVDIYELIAKTYIDHRQLYIAGNGGSAADAQHIAAELVGRFKRDRRGLCAIALTTDTSCLTAIGNDYSFEDIFSRQVEAQFRHGDLLWLLSVSGASPNIVKAAKMAKQMGGNVALFTGMKCTDFSFADVAFVVEAESCDTVQECHQFAYHLICDWVESRLA